MNVKALRYSLAALVLLLAGTAASVSADEQKTIFYNVTTDDAWAAGMALAQAGSALDAGYKVVIFLNVRGVFIADKSFATDLNGLSRKSLRDMLKAAMGKGAQAIICPMCMQKAGMSMDDLIEGVVKGGPDVTLKAMTADNTVVISY
jgi:predicted peroxiredoxin